VRIRKPIADELLAAARDALPMPDAAIARQVLAADLALACDLDRQVAQAEVELARLLPLSPYRTLTSVPGWAVVRAGNYAGALGDPARFSNPRQVYRSAGLNPIQYESAGKRHDTRISREGSVELRQALIDLGMGLWLNEPAATARAVELRARGKKGGVIACAMAHRANRIAFAMVRDQAVYDPSRWT
jgi:transposase